MEGLPHDHRQGSCLEVLPIRQIGNMENRNTVFAMPSGIGGVLHAR